MRWIAFGLCAATLLVACSSSGPSSDERLACAAVQDYIDAYTLGSPQAAWETDLARAGNAANRSSNTALGGAVESLREAVELFFASNEQVQAALSAGRGLPASTGQAALQSQQSAHNAEVSVRRQCGSAGITVRPSDLPNETPPFPNFNPQQRSGPG